MASAEAVAKQYAADIEEPSSEAMLMHAVLGTTPSWALSDHDTLHDSYFKKRTRKSGLRAPRVLEVAITLDLAERHRLAGALKRMRSLISLAIEHSPDLIALRRLEDSAGEHDAIEWRSLLFPAAAEPSDQESAPVA